MLKDAFDGGPYIAGDLFAEEPVGGAAGDSLHDAVMRMDGIDRADTPTVVIAVLAVVHTYLPPVGAAVATPPFAAYIAVIQSPIRDRSGIGIAGLVIDIIRHEDRINRFTHRDTRDDGGSLLVVTQCLTEKTEIDTVSGIVTSTHIPYAGKPPAGAMAAIVTMRVAEHIIGVLQGRTMIERDGREDRIDDGPDNTLEGG